MEISAILTELGTQILRYLGTIKWSTKMIEHVLINIIHYIHIYYKYVDRYIKK